MWWCNKNTTPVAWDTENSDMRQNSTTDKLIFNDMEIKQTIQWKWKILCVMLIQWFHNIYDVSSFGGSTNIKCNF